MRVNREAIDSPHAIFSASGDADEPESFQGLVLQASGARALGSEEWESAVGTARGGGYPPPVYGETSPSVLAEDSRRRLSGEISEHNENETMEQRALDEDKPSATSVPNARVPATRSRTRRQQHNSTQLQAHEEHKEEAKEEDPSPSSNSTGAKKARKRPHYLSHEDRCQIIERIAGGEQQAALAREFGVTRAAVCHIQKHRFEILARPVNQPVGEATSTPGPTRDQQLVHEVRTASSLLLLTTLRDHRSDSSSFRRAAGRLITCARTLWMLGGLDLAVKAHIVLVHSMVATWERRILFEEVLGQLDARAVEVTTAGGHVTTGIERRHELCGVKLGDEGYPFSVLFHQVEVEAAEGYIHVDAVVDERGHRQWRLDCMDLPASIASCKVLLFTATCSTGMRECKAIETLCGVGALEKDITLVSIVCASDGVVAVCSRFPQVRIVTAAIDGTVDPFTGCIVPGFGDFVARYNDECAHLNLNPRQLWISKA